MSLCRSQNPQVTYKERLLLNAIVPISGDMIWHFRDREVAEESGILVQAILKSGWNVQINAINPISFDLCPGVVV
jgi:hypothetical protein